MLDLIIVSVGRAGVIVAQVASIRALTTLLTPAEAGDFYIVTAIVGSFSLILVGPVSTYFARHLLEWQTRQQARHVHWLFVGYVFAVAVLAAVIPLAVAHFIGLGTFVTIDLTLLAALGLFFTGISGTALAGLNILGRRRANVGLSNLGAWLTILLCVGLATAYSGSAKTWLAGQVLAQLVLAILSGTLFLRQLHDSDGIGDGKLSSREVFAFSWPLAIGVAFFWVQSQSYRIVVPWILDNSAVGLFAAGYAIGAGLMIAFEGLFHQLYQPIFFKRIATGDLTERTAAWSDYCAVFAPSLVLTTVFVTTTAEHVTRVFASAAFHGVADVVRWSALIEAARILSGMFYFSALAERRMGVLIPPTIAGAAVAVAGVWFLPRFAGLGGIGAALLLAAVVNLVLTGTLINRVMSASLPWARMAIAMAVSLPLLIALLIEPKNGIVHALWTLSGFGLYFLGGQAWLIKQSQTKIQKWK